MFIPTRVQFDDAITIPKIRLKITDPELKLGSVEIVQGTIPGPYGMQGGFAIVYKFKTRSGKLRALRVFTRQMEPDIRSRYEKMGPYFKSSAKNVTAEFTYHESAIAVKNDLGASQVFPLIEMEWVEGVDLLKKLDELCKARNRVALGKLVDEWIALLNTLRQAHIVHGDLSGGNIMVRSDGRLVLVDYDGVYIPDFAGRNPIVLGQPDYQHPDFYKRPFDEWMDEFSALVIYTGMLALQVKPELWDKYAKYQAGKLISENLLFRSEDFKAPNQSAIFQDLYKLGDPKVKAALDELKKACTLPIKSVRLPTTLIDPEYEEKKALVVLVEAIKKDDDEEIAKAWVPRLEKYALAQPHRSRVELAQKRVSALNGFRTALKTDRDDKIVFGYDKALLDGYGKITPAERKRHELATKRMVALQKVRRALAANDEEKLAAEYDPILDGCAELMPPERLKIDQARRCGDMRERVRKAIAADEDDLIVTAYDAKLVRPWTNFTPDEQKRIDLAQKRSAALSLFRAALQKGDDKEIVFAYDKILDGYSKVKPIERERRELALKRMLALKRVKDAIASGDEEKIVAAYDPKILDNYPALVASDRQKIKLAQQCFAMRENVRKAIVSGDDALIVAAHDPQLVRLWTNFTPDEQKRIDLAQKRSAALKKFRGALDADKDRDIVFGYDKVLDGYPKVTSTERARHELATKRLLALKRVQDAIAAGDEEKMVAAYDPILDNYPPLVTSDRLKIQLAHQCVQMRTNVRKAILSDDDEQVLVAYDTKLIRPWTNFTADEQKRVEKAQKRTTALADFRAALKTNDDEKIVLGHESILDGYGKVAADEQQRYALAKKRMVALRQVEKALKYGSEEKISAAYDPILDNYAKIAPADREKIRRAQQCVEMRDKVREAFKTDDDEAIAKAYDAGLVRPWMNLSVKEQKRIEQAHKRTTALAAFRVALQSNADEPIVSKYVSILDNYSKVTPAERERLALAKKRIALLKTLRLALSGDDDRKIAAAYDPILDGYPALLSAEWQRIDLARRRVKMFDETRQAIQSDDDPQIVQFYDDKLLRATLVFTPAEQQRIVLAQKRTTALGKFHAALKSDDDDIILKDYNSILDNYNIMTSAERERYALARKRVAALTTLRVVLANDDERKIAAAYDPILDNYSKLTPAERGKVDLARRCVEFPGRMRQAIQSGDDEKIVQVFDASLLRPWTSLTPEETQRIELARQRVELEQRRRAAIIRLHQAIASNDDEKILAEYDTILDGSPLVNPAERARMALAHQRITALGTFRVALTTLDDRNIEQGYNNILDGYARVTNAENQRLDQARRCVAMPQLVRKGIGEDDDEKIVQVFRRDLIRPWTGFTSDELLRIELAQKRVDALTRFRNALQTKDERKIVIDYDHILDKCKNVKPDERTQLETARRCVEMPRAVRIAIAANDDDRIAQIFEPQLDRIWSDLTKEERERIELAQKRIGLKNDIIRALERGEVDEADRLAAKAGGPIVDQRITAGKAKFIRNREPSNLRIELETGEFTAKWDWNPDPQVQIVALVWRTDRMPSSPGEIGTSVRHVTRGEYDRANGIACKMPVQVSHVFVRAFSAIRDNKPYPADNWIYSLGAEQTARATESRLPPVTCRVLPASGSKSKQIVIQTGDGSPLPELIVLRKEDNLPMSVNDGVPVLKHKPVQAATSAQNISISVDPSWSRYSTLRLFVRHNNQWIPVGGKIQV